MVLNLDPKWFKDFSKDEFRSLLIGRKVNSPPWISLVDFFRTPTVRATCGFASGGVFRVSSRVGGWVWALVGIGFGFDDLITDEIFWVALLTPVNHVLWEGEASNGGSPHHRVVSRRGMGHLHCIELKERLAKSHTTQQELPEKRG